MVNGQQEAKKANVTYNRLKELSKEIATEYVLHKYDIAEPSLVAMVNQPAKLICQLYETHGARDTDVRDQPPGRWNYVLKKSARGHPTLTGFYNGVAWKWGGGGMMKHLNWRHHFEF